MDGTLDSKERRTREDRAVAVGGRDQEGRKFREEEGNGSAFMNEREGRRIWGREKGNRCPELSKSTAQHSQSVSEALESLLFT